MIELRVALVCLFVCIVGAVAVPFPVRPNTSTLQIYPKASISNVNHENGVDLSSLELSAPLYGLVPIKRSTMLLNKLMHALHKALDNENEDTQKIVIESLPDEIPENFQLDLQRRGEDKMTRYWRCYFNAVSCF